MIYGHLAKEDVELARASIPQPCNPFLSDKTLGISVGV